MPLSEASKEAVAAFTQHYMYAVTGMQLRDMDLRVIDPKQFAVTLACALYAAGRIKQEGLLSDLPHPDDEANYSAFGEQVAQRYATMVNNTAVANVKELVERLDLEAVQAFAEQQSGQLEDQLKQLARVEDASGETQ